MTHRIAPCTVFVPKPLEMSHGDAMNRLRRWLDDKKMQARGFKIPADGAIGIEITVLTESDATKLEAFDWSPVPAVNWRLS